jgi:hypothetical protein
VPSLLLVMSAPASAVTHPNLVKMLGYVTRPRLYIVQEFMAGSSLEKQLYVERWRPTPRQVLQAALGVAEGMHWLHKGFEKDGVQMPLIHRCATDTSTHPAAAAAAGAAAGAGTQAAAEAAKGGGVTTPAPEWPCTHAASRVRARAGTSRAATCCWSSRRRAGRRRTSSRCPW